MPKSQQAHNQKIILFSCKIVFENGQLLFIFEHNCPFII